MRVVNCAYVITALCFVAKNFRAVTAILTYRRVRKIAKSECYLRHVRVSVRVKQQRMDREKLTFGWYLEMVI